MNTLFEENLTNEEEITPSSGAGCAGYCNSWCATSASGYTCEGTCYAACKNSCDGCKGYCGGFLNFLTGG